MNTDVLVPAALVFVREVDAAYPGRGTESDGSLASSDHSASNPTSDHEHGTPQPGDRDVDAVDLDADLLPGDAAGSRRAMYEDVIPAFERHPGTQYWIHDDKICHRSEGWVPRSYAYAGPKRNRHTKHTHFNWQETATAHNNTSPYGIEGAPMQPADFDKIRKIVAEEVADVAKQVFAFPIILPLQPGESEPRKVDFYTVVRWLDAAELDTRRKVLAAIAELAPATPPPGE